MASKTRTVKKKDLIMNTAIRLFLEQGYEATSLQQIADASETSSALIIYHFGTKDGILKQFLESLMQEARSVVRAKVDMCMNPEVFLCTFVRLWQSVMASDTYCRFYHDIINVGVFQKYFFVDNGINVSDLILAKRKVQLSPNLYSFFCHYTLPALEFASWLSMGDLGPDDEKIDIPFIGFMRMIGVGEDEIAGYCAESKKIAKQILEENPQLIEMR